MSCLQQLAPLSRLKYLTSHEREHMTGENTDPGTH